MANTAALANAIAARDQAAANLLALEIAGPQAWVDYSLDGESYQYEAAKKGLTERIDRLTDLVQKLDGPYIVRSIQR